MLTTYRKPRYPLSFWEPWSICTRAQEEEEEIAGTYEPEYHAPPYEDAVAAEPIEAVNHSPGNPTFPPTLGLGPVGARMVGDLLT